MRGTALGAALGGAIAACFSRPPAPEATGDARRSDGMPGADAPIDAPQIGSCAALAIDPFMGPQALGSCSGMGSVTVAGGMLTMTPMTGSSPTAALGCTYSAVSFAKAVRIHVPTIVMQTEGATELQLMTDLGFTALWSASYNNATFRYELAYSDDNGSGSSTALDAAAMSWWLLQIDSPQHMSAWYGSDGASWTSFASTTLGSGDLTQPGTLILYAKTQGGSSAVFDHFERCR